MRPSPKEFLAKSVRQSVNNAKFKTEKPQVKLFGKVNSKYHDHFKNTGTFKQGLWMHNNDPIGGKQCRPKNRQQRGELIIGKSTFCFANIFLYF